MFGFESRHCDYRTLQSHRAEFSAIPPKWDGGKEAQGGPADVGQSASPDPEDGQGKTENCPACEAIHRGLKDDRVALDRSADPMNPAADGDQSYVIPAKLPPFDAPR